MIAKIFQWGKNQQSTLTFVLNSVDAPNSKRNLTTSLWPCWAAKNRAVVPDWGRERGWFQDVWLHYKTTSLQIKLLA